MMDDAVREPDRIRGKMGRKRRGYGLALPYNPDSRMMPVEECRETWPQEEVRQAVRMINKGI